MVLILKRTWPDINTGATIFKWNDKGTAQVIPRNDNGHACVLSGLTNQARFKNNTFVLILKHL